MALATSPPAVASEPLPRISLRSAERLVPVGLALVAALPFLILLAALLATRPAITSYGDRAVIALEVRDLLHGHQLVGAYARYGWHHPGPAFLIPLAAASVVFGGAHWALDAGMVAGLAVGAAAFVVVSWRGAGRVGGLVAAGVVGLYVRDVGPATLRNPWNPWAVLLPLGLLVVLGGLMGTGSLAAASTALLVTTVLVQTHVGVAPVCLGILITGALLWWSARGGTAPDRTEWARPGVWVPAAATAVLWIPPIIQEATGADPNLTDLWRFFTASHPGHNLPTSVAAVGRALGQFPFGSPSRFLATAPSVTWGGALRPSLVLVAYLGVAAAIVVAARTGQRNRFAEAVGLVTIVAVITAVFAVQSVDGALNGYIIAWVTVLPLGCWVGVAAIVSSVRPGVGRRRSSGRPPVSGSGSGSGVPLSVSVVLAFLVAGWGVVAGISAAAAAPSAVAENSPTVVAAWASVEPQLPHVADGTVLLRLTNPAAWPVQAGLALEFEEHGWRAHVEPGWVFMFGASRAETGTENLVVTIDTSTVTVAVAPPPQLPGALVGATSRLAQMLERSVGGP